MPSQDEQDGLMLDEGVEGLIDEHDNFVDNKHMLRTNRFFEQRTQTHVYAAPFPYQQPAVQQAQGHSPQQQHVAAAPVKSCNLGARGNGADDNKVDGANVASQEGREQKFKTRANVDTAPLYDHLDKQQTSWQISVQSPLYFVGVFALLLSMLCDTALGQTCQIVITESDDCLLLDVTQCSLCCCFWNADTNDCTHFLGCPTAAPTTAVPTPPTSSPTSSPTSGNCPLVINGDEDCQFLGYEFCSACCCFWNADQNLCTHVIPCPTPKPTEDPTLPTETPTHSPTSGTTTTEPTTAEPTTATPTTAQPTTDEPTTDAPTTAAPTTDEPTTAAPTTSAPTTSAPTTSAPTTSAPTTAAPTTAAPTTAAPTTVAPTTSAPTTDDSSSSKSSSESSSSSSSSDADIHVRVHKGKPSGSSSDENDANDKKMLKSGKDMYVDTDGDVDTIDVDSMDGIHGAGGNNNGYATDESQLLGMSEGQSNVMYTLLVTGAFAVLAIAIGVWCFFRRSSSVIEMEHEIEMEYDVETKLNASLAVHGESDNL